MWDLGYKESWVPKNWRFWTVVLEKTLESPLDCKEIKPVNPKGNQSWIFIGRTDVEAETPILWPPDSKNWLIGKDPDSGKDWRQEEKGTEDEMLGWHHQLDGHEFEQALGVHHGQGSLACCSPWDHRVGHHWATELNWTLCVPLHLAKQWHYSLSLHPKFLLWMSIQHWCRGWVFSIKGRGYTYSREAWHAVVRGVAENQTWLSNWIKTYL